MTDLLLGAVAVVALFVAWIYRERTSWPLGIVAGLIVCFPLLRVVYDTPKVLIVFMLWGGSAYGLYRILPRIFWWYDYTDQDRATKAEMQAKLILHSVGFAMFLLVGLGWLSGLLRVAN